MLRFDHAVTFAQRRLEERADTGLEQHMAPARILHRQAAAGQRDASVPVRCNPARPQRLRSIARHRAAIQLLRIARDQEQFHDATLLHLAQFGWSARIAGRIECVAVAMPGHHVHAPHGARGFKVQPIAVRAALPAGSNVPGTTITRSGGYR